MSKKRFVQGVVVRRLPMLDELHKAVRYAEALWDALTHIGYGDAAPAQPRESKCWTDELTPRQAQAFKVFWEAFAHKKGLQRAAMRWLQLGELGKAEYLVIIEAAGQEALRPVPPGQARKMAEGWLAERRWEDFAKAAQDPAQQRKLALNQLNNERVALKSLHAASGSPALLAQIRALEQKITVLSEGGAHGR